MRFIDVIMKPNKKQSANQMIKLINGFNKKQYGFFILINNLI